MSLLYLIIVFCLLFQAGPVARADEKTIAFVVGVQHYREPDLNKLQFTAKDAQDVFLHLQAITNLDLDRSRLLMATETEPETPAPSYVIHRQVLTANDILKEFRSFLQRARSNDQLIFYFGGHGIDQANRFLLFLPSNYIHVSPVAYLRYDDLLRDIKGRIDDEGLNNVSVIFFANMCGAGTAAGTMSVDNDLDAEFVRRWLDENSLGFQRFAFFPATAKRRDTHEDLNFGRSIFAYHLINGLRGAAANDAKEITADSLFRYLDEKIEDELPKHPDAFDGTIRIGTTREQDATGAYLLGTSLLGIAADRNVAMLNRLAQAQLRRVSQLSHKLSGLSHLRAGQGLAARGQIDRAQDEFKSALRDPALPAFARRASHQLIESGIVKHNYPTLKSYTDYLNRGGPFYALFISVLNPRFRRQEASNPWINLLANIPGYRESHLIAFDPSPDKIYSPTVKNEVEHLMASAKIELDRWRKEIRSGESMEQSPPHLLIVYDGVAGKTGKQLVPVSQTDFERLAKYWPGSVVVIYSAPFGGLLFSHDIGIEKHDIALFISGIEDNAMTFGRAGQRSITSELMMAALTAGVEDFSQWEPLRKYETEVEGYLPKDSEWVVGKPEWVPSWSRTDIKASTVAKQHLRPLRRWPALLAGGCVDRTLIQCEDDLSRRIRDADHRDAEGLPDGEDLFQTLKVAAEFDIAGQSAEASGVYREFLSQLDNIKPTMTSEQPFLRTVFTSAEKQLDRLARQVRARSEGASGKAVRRIFLLRVAVEDYESPFIVDLNYTSYDLENWANAMKQRFGEILVIKPLLKNPADSKTIFKSLSDLVDEASDDDLLVFLYSGRGYEFAGRRYITASNVALASSEDREPKGSEGLVDLAKIAALADGKWLFAVYDAQFTPPTFEADRIDGLYDKHIHSVRPLPFEAAARSSAESLSGPLESPTARAGQGIPPRLLSSEGLPPRQVHVFWEGRLTEAQVASRPCGPAHGIRSLVTDDSTANDYSKRPSYSSLTGALLRSLDVTEPTTYRKLAERAAQDRCLEAGHADGQIVFQGDLDVPLFATGQAAEYIVYFRNEQERIELNIRTGLGIAVLTEEGSREDIDRLTRAALQVLLIEQIDALPGRLRKRHEQERARLIFEADKALSQINRVKLDQQYPALDGAVLDLKTQILRLKGEGDAARRLLLQAPRRVIGRHPELLQRLVSLTDDLLRSKPTDVIKQTDEFLKTLDPNATAWTKSLRQRWQKLIETTLRSARESYRIRGVVSQEAD